MDDGRGNFIPMENLDNLEHLQEQHPKHGGVFSLGEIVELKGSRFKVKSINPTTIRLKLLKNS